MKSASGTHLTGIAAAAILVVGAVAACGTTTTTPTTSPSSASQPTSSPATPTAIASATAATVTPRPSDAITPTQGALIALAKAVYPATGANCQGSGSSVWTSCPLSASFTAKLNAIAPQGNVQSSTGSGYQVLCHCQESPSNPFSYKATVTSTGGTAVVSEADGSATYTLTIVEQQGRLLVDDITVNEGSGGTCGKTIDITDTTTCP